MIFAILVVGILNSVAIFFLSRKLSEAQNMNESFHVSVGDLRAKVYALDKVVRSTRQAEIFKADRVSDPKPQTDAEITGAKNRFDL